MESTKIYSDEYTSVVVIDSPDPDSGGACHTYAVLNANGDEIGRVEFQHGPIGEHGVNGMQHAHLLSMIQHRLDCFQKGPFASGVNETTCGFVSAALGSEATRTRRRRQAGVEGLNQPARGVETAG